LHNSIDIALFCKEYDLWRMINQLYNKLYELCVYYVRRVQYFTFILSGKHAPEHCRKCEQTVYASRLLDERALELNASLSIFKV